MKVWSGGSPPPRWGTERSGRESFGPAVAEVAAALDRPLMPWQQRVVDVALEHVDGRLAFRDVVLSVPRQAGKSTLLMALIVWRMLAHPQQRLAFGAQTRLAARGKLFDDLWPLIRRSTLGGRFELTRATGAEALRCSNGSLLRVLSTEEAAGHGETLDLVLLDEAWALDAATEQAVRPAMVTRQNAQMWVTSTAGSARSTWFRGKVEAGRAAVEAGTSEGVAFFEWSAVDDADPADPATWANCHPAFGHTISADVFEADHTAMALGEFRRSHLNQWVGELADAGWRIVDRDAWEQAAL